MKSLLALLVALPLFGQLPAVPNSDFPTFRSNLNTSLGLGVNRNGSYSNPSWITSIDWSKLLNVPTFVPTGGTAGQVLAKIDSTNYNTTWVTPSGSVGPTGPTGPAGATGPTGPSGSQFTCSLSSDTTKVCTHSLNTSTPVWTCYDASGNILGGATATTSVSDAVATSVNILTFTFSAATTGTCKISSGGTGAAGAAGPTGPTGPTGPSGSGSGTIGTGTNPQIAQYDGSGVIVVKAVTMSGDATMADGGAVTLNAKYRVKSCIVIVGDPGSASVALADDNDTPVACSNNLGVDWTLTSVGCWANAGSPTITPILTGGSSTSILSSALTCGTAGWAGAAVNGTPVLHTFSGSGGITCSSTPCTADVNITTAGGTAKYIVVKLVGTY